MYHFKTGRIWSNSSKYQWKLHRSGAATEAHAVTYKWHRWASGKEREEGWQSEGDKETARCLWKISKSSKGKRAKAHPHQG